MGLQTVFAATHWNPIYWNTACLIVNTGSLETDEWDAEDENSDNSKTKTKDYGRLATAIGAIRSRGIKISLIDINNSSLGFIPDTESNEILFGLNGCARLNKDLVEKILSGRPYNNIKDFMNRCPLAKPVMVSLIKAGAFDKISDWAQNMNVEPRIANMIYYLSVACEPKTRLTLQNFNSLIQYDLIPNELEETKKVFEFNKYLKTKKLGQYYQLDTPAYNYYKKNFDEEKLEVINDKIIINQKTWDKIYSAEMDKVRNWIKENKEQILTELNTKLFEQTWEKYAKGTISSWEMDSLCFYYHAHELSNVDFDKYGIKDFNELESREIEGYIKRNRREIPIFKIYTIAGTVIAKNDTKATVNLLTPTGVVPVKFNKEYYSMFKKRICQLNKETGKKQIVEEGWFKKGTLLLVNGYRREDTFVAKTYKSTNAHQLYKILSINSNHTLTITSERAKGEEDDE